MSKRKKSTLTVVNFTSKVEFASVHTPKKNIFKEGESEYAVTLLLDSKEEKALTKLLEDAGVKMTVINPSTEEIVPRIRKGQDGIARLQVKRNSVNYKGEPVHITVVDAELNNIPKNVLIGNGSLCNVEMLITENPKNGKKAIKLSGIQVLELVRYSKGGGSSFTKAEGFAISKEDLEGGDDETEEDDDIGIDEDVF